MIWISYKGSSYAIVSCNKHVENSKIQLWVERTNGKTLKIAESGDEREIDVVKDAIDFAIESGESLLRL